MMILSVRFVFNILFCIYLVLLPGKQTDAANIIEGRYTLQSSDNFDNYLKELGVNFILRNLAKLATPTETISRNCPESAPIRDPSCTWTKTTSTAFKGHTVQFKLGTTVNDKTLDDRQVTSTFTMESDDTLVEEQRSKRTGQVTTLRMRFTQAGMQVNMRVNNVAASSFFRRA